MTSNIFLTAYFAASSSISNPQELMVDTFIINFKANDNKYRYLHFSNFCRNYVLIFCILYKFMLID